jgi:heme/copper-type cytochrome/quinol oxidase subunit 2
MMSLWYMYVLVAVLLVIVLVIAAIGFSRSGRRRATDFEGVA